MKSLESICECYNWKEDETMSESDIRTIAGSMIPQEKDTVSINWHGSMTQVSAENVFRRNEKANKQRDMLRKHKAWLELIQHEYPMPYKHYRIGVYIRYFNQTKYENYLDYHKQQFIDTIALCPNWELVDFYVDEGISAPNMESAKEWCRLLDDCFAGKIDLIITQKVSNVSRKPSEIAFIARILAAQKNPVGMYFISEDLFTLASYYQDDLREKGFLPDGWELLPDEESDLPRLKEGETVDQSLVE